MIPVFTRKHVTRGVGRKIKPHFSEGITFDAMFSKARTMMTTAFVVANCFFVVTVLDKTSFTFLFSVHLIIVTFATTILAHRIECH